MLELVARCGGARILQWTREAATVRTPLVLLHAAAGAAERPGTGILARQATAVEAAPSVPVVRLAGGFHTEETDDATPDAWATITVARPRRIVGQLALRAAHDAAVPEPTGNDEVVVFAEAASTARDPKRIVPALIEAREAAGPARLLHAPGIGLPHQLALLTYAGIDILDTLATERATHEGLYLTPAGAEPAAELKAATCVCAACQEAPPAKMDHKTLLRHNLQALLDERDVVSGHIENGTLRELVEQRARAHPGTAAVLRHLDRQTAHFADRIPLTPGRTLRATTMESLQRPDVVRFRDRIRDQYVPPAAADILLLLPCSAIKPYATSKSHGVFQRVLGDLHSASLVHEVILTSPLGLVPRELERTWPAAHYDVPVTGVWDREEEHMIREQVRALVAKGTYRRVIAHLDQRSYDMVRDLLPEDHVHTGAPHPTDYAARDRLRGTLKDATRGITAPTWPKRRMTDAHAIATWQFGRDAADALFADAGDVSGRPPMLRIYAERGKRDTIATFVPDKGLLVLTMEGARRLYDAGCAKTVEIDDFMPRGTLFAVGVRDADPRIIPGDEVVLTHEGEVRGVGSAVATGTEMRGFARGPCVEVRHHA